MEYESKQLYELNIALFTSQLLIILLKIFHIKALNINKLNKVDIFPVLTAWYEKTSWASAEILYNSEAKALSKGVHKTII